MSDNKIKPLEIGLLILLFLTSVGLLLLDYSMSEDIKTPSIGSLLKVTQFTSSIALGFYLQRIQSREEFQSSLKKFALSAYRRIIDIEKVINRLVEKIDYSKSNIDNTKVSDIEVIKELALSIKMTISSSIADWKDIIGEEVKLVERIGALETKEAIIKSTSQKSTSDQEQANLMLDKINAELSNLRSELPIILQGVNHMNDYAGPFSPEYSKTVEQFILNTVESTGYIPLMISPWNGDLKSILTINTPVQFRLDSAMFQVHMEISIGEQFSGEIINPFEPAVNRNDYVVTLNTFLSDVAVLQGNLPIEEGGPPAIIIRNVEFVMPSSVYEGSILIRIPASIDIFSKG